LERTISDSKPSTTVRRVKTYTAQTGYVYEYYFVGKRAALETDPCAPSTEFIFDVSADRKSIFAVSVFLPSRALDAYAADHGRTLSQPEQYAAAKLRLLEGFDEIANMLLDGRRLTLDAVTLASLLQSIGVD
jgi:hypothetical protein